MTWSEVAKVSSNITELEGVLHRNGSCKKIRASQAASHIIGYVGRPEKEESPKLSSRRNKHRKVGS